MKILNYLLASTATTLTVLAGKINVPICPELSELKKPENIKKSEFLKSLVSRKTQVHKRFDLYKFTNVINLKRPIHFSKYWKDNFSTMNRNDPEISNLFKDLDSNFKDTWELAVQLVKNNKGDQGEHLHNGLSSNTDNKSFEEYYDKIIHFYCIWNSFELTVNHITEELQNIKQKATNRPNNKINKAGITTLMSKIANLFTIRDKFWADKKSGRVLGKSAKNINNRGEDWSNGRPDISLRPRPNPGNGGFGGFGGFGAFARPAQHNTGIPNRSAVLGRPVLVAEPLSRKDLENDPIPTNIGLNLDDYLMEMDGNDIKQVDRTPPAIMSRGMGLIRNRLG